MRLTLVDNTFDRAVRAILAEWKQLSIPRTTLQRVEEICEGDRPDQIWATILLYSGLSPDLWRRYYTVAWARQMGVQNDVLQIAVVAAAADRLLCLCAWDPTPPTNIGTLPSTSGLAAWGRKFLLYCVAWT
ncbi:hypothetical protein COV06_02295 [Candidatus Uhrbacteria bacterium CG10_big_fil_rev_8_21_14_0_10_50_16]|uniref:Uncharacterized protein n=1 Tax=Candidatus Uhrbacteria bacterium CG10_big_fil_rev_8_21_14_0_10_50_16 TaxID=1975039 RepID=A0A2H0RM42_9BACT|nr:MAG: hypothetical protein COV06_02295 [Candidatus Uhrbacteria bacterium CG10_big_fil_rev_8_21_14_0_10_50_16]